MPDQAGAIALRAEAFEHYATARIGLLGVLADGTLGREQDHVQNIFNSLSWSAAWSIESEDDPLPAPTAFSCQATAAVFRQAVMQLRVIKRQLRGQNGGVELANAQRDLEAARSKLKEAAGLLSSASSAALDPSFPPATKPAAPSWLNSIVSKLRRRGEPPKQG